MIRPYVLFICKLLTRLRAKHFGLARHFKTDPTETVALCFGYPKTPCLRANGKLSFCADEQAISEVLVRATEPDFCLTTRL
jgi:hypothetical protein